MGFAPSVVNRSAFRLATKVTKGHEGLIGDGYFQGFFATLSRRNQAVKLRLVIFMDARLREGIRLFNAGRYFEAHESLEGFYLHSAGEEHKPFLEGLIQIAAALRLCSEFGEVKGPVRMIRQALIRLEAYQPNYLGVRVKRLIQTMEAWSEATEAKEKTGKDARARESMPQISVRRLLFF